MDGALHTLDEAAKLTGLSIEALRKRFLRGQIEGVGSRESNDGKIRLRLTDAQAADLRKTAEKVDSEAPEAVGLLSTDLPVQVLSRLADSLERRLARAEDEAAAARTALDAERKARDQERREWTGKLADLTAEIAALQGGRAADRRVAGAALERARRTAAELNSKVDGILARVPTSEAQPVPRQPGLLARLLRR